MSHLLLTLPIIWLAVLSPGADFAMITRVSCVDGRRAGITAALGIALGCWLHILYAVFGLDLVARVFPHFLAVLKVAGACYLVWLGWSMARSRPAAPAPGASAIGDDDAVRGRRQPLVTGLLTNALNPKTSVFVISLYAQAIGPDAPLPAKLGYGAIISLSHLAWFAAVALFLSHPVIRARVIVRQHIANRIIGTILIVLGVALGLSDLKA